MPDYAVRTSIITKDTASPMFMKAARSADRFGVSADRSMDKASRSMDKLGGTIKKSMGASTKAINRSLRSIDKLADRFDRQIDRMERRSVGFKGISGGILGADIIREGFRAATREIGSFIMEGAKIQRATTEFGTFLKSAEKGAQVIADLRALGARTPFEFEDFQIATKIMLGMRATTQEELIPTLTMLGDTASGSADKLTRIAYAFSEVKANGRATMQEIRQFTNAGVPLLATVADMYREVGDSTEEAMARVRKMTKDGKLTGEVMVKAFKIMTSEGGMFFQGMEKTSRDFLGRLSTLKDEITITKQTIGLGLIPTLTKYVDEGILAARSTALWAEANQGLIKEEVIKWLDTGKRLLEDIAPILKTVLEIVNNLLPVVRELSPLLPILAAGWLANKVALAGLAAIKAASMIVTITSAVWAAFTGTMAWNAAILLIPGTVAGLVTAVIAGVTLIAGGIFMLVKHWDTVRDALVKGAKIIFSVWSRVLFFPIMQFVKGIGFLGKMIGKALGIKSLETEFGNLMQTMDDFDNKLAKIGRDAPKPFKIIDNSVQRTRVKFGGLTPDMTPAYIEPGSPEFLRKSIFDFGTPEQESALGKTAAENIVKKTTEAKQIIEHVVKLVVPGKNGERAFTLTPGSNAPPVEIDLLGEN